MLIIGITTLLVGLYSGLVVGTYKKFKMSGINFIGKTRVLFVFFPLGFILLHLFWAFLELFKDRKFSMHMFKMIFFKYPVVLGMLIEHLLEYVAYNISQNDKIVKMKRKSNRKKAVRKKKVLDLENIPKYPTQKKLYAAYKRTVLDAAL